MIRNGQASLAPRTVIQGNRYSAEFEACWQQIVAPDAGDCYLEGTSKTIRELLTPAWELNPCSRCSMPIPVHSIGLPPTECPCFDLPNWPDTETPQPRSPIDTQAHLGQIRDRLKACANKQEASTS